MTMEIDHSLIDFSIERSCYAPDCGRLIGKAFGFVLARDVLAVIEGKKPVTGSIRELCGGCGLKMHVAFYNGEYEINEYFEKVLGLEQACGGS